MKKTCLFVLIISFLPYSIGNAADWFKIFDSTFSRETGAPLNKSEKFIGSADVARIVLINGGLPNSGGKKVSSATIKINGKDVFVPSEFNQIIYQLEKQINLLEGENVVDVKLNANPGGKINLQIYQHGKFIESSVGGTISSVNLYGDVVALEIPPNSINKSETIKVTVLDYPSVRPIANIVYPGVKIEPEGLILNKPVKLKFTLADTFHDNKFALIFYLKTPELPLAIANQTTTSNSIEGEIFHFSTYFAGAPSQDEIQDLARKINFQNYPGINCMANFDFIDEVYSWLSYYGWHKALEDDLIESSLTSVKGFVYEGANNILGTPIQENPTEECVKSLEWIIKLVDQILGVDGKDIIDGFQSRLCAVKQRTPTPVKVSRVVVPLQGWPDCPLVGNTYKLKAVAYDGNNNPIGPNNADWLYFNWTTSNNDTSVALLTEHLKEWELSAAGVGKVVLTASACGQSAEFPLTFTEFPVCGVWNVTEEEHVGTCRIWFPKDPPDNYLWDYVYAFSGAYLETNSYNITVRYRNGGYNITDPEGNIYPMTVNNIYPGASKYELFFIKPSIETFYGNIYNNGTIDGASDWSDDQRYLCSGSGIPLPKDAFCQWCTAYSIYSGNNAGYPK